MKKKNIVITSLLFLVCLGVGFGLTKWATRDNQREEQSVESETTNTPVEVTPVPSAPISDTTEPEPTPPKSEPTPPKPEPTPITTVVKLRPRPVVADDPEPAPKMVEMTKEEFERMLNDPNDNVLLGTGSEKVSGAVRITAIHLREDEVNKPSDVLGVRQKKEFGIWPKGAKVVSVGRDENGRIISAEVEQRK